MRDFSTNKFYFYDENRNVSLDSENRLGIVQHTLLNKQLNYLVTIKYFDADDTKEQKRLDYAIDITFLGKNIWLIDKFDFFYNRREPTMIIEQLVDKINKSIFPLKVFINNEGFIDTINNIETIKKRWTKTKISIIKEHKGRIVDLLLKKTDRELNKPVNFTYSFAKDMFWSVFFNANTINYGKQFETKHIIQFPFEAYKFPLVYSGLSRVNPYTTESKTIETVYEGTALIPKESKLYRKKENSVLKSKLSINYFLEEETRLPVLIKAISTLFGQEERKNIKKIELSIAKQEKV